MTRRKIRYISLLCFIVGSAALAQYVAATDVKVITRLTKVRKDHTG